MTTSRKISERQWEQRLLGYAGLLADQALSDSLFDQLTDRMYEDWPGHTALIRYDGAGRMEGSPVARGEVERGLQQYQDYYYGLNPYPKIVREHDLSDRTVIMSRYLPRPRLWKGEYYNDFLRPLSVEYVIGMSVRFPDASRISCSVYRGDHEGGEFDQTDVRRLDSLRPFIRQALTLRRLWKQQPRRASNAPAAAEELAEPALLILQDGSIRPLNQAGERYLAQRRGSSGADLMQEIRSRYAGCGEIFKAASVPGGTQLPANSSVGILGERRRRIQALLDLSPRECDVTVELLNGLSNREIAERLGISTETCRSYVKSIHRKTGFGSTARLITALYKLV